MNNIMSYLQTWQRFGYVLDASRRLDDLQGLIKWAERKHLIGVSDHYKRLFVHEANSLKACCHCYPETVKWARGFYKLTHLILPTPRYYRKGAGAAYRTATNKFSPYKQLKCFAPQNQHLQQLFAYQAKPEDIGFAIGYV